MQTFFLLAALLLFLLLKLYRIFSKTTIRKDSRARSWFTDLLNDIRINCFREYLKAVAALRDLSDYSCNDVSKLLLREKYPALKSLSQAYGWNGGLPAKAGPGRKVRTRLMELKDELSYHHQSLQEFLPYYSKQASQSETEYYKNILELSRMHDELARYMQMKNFDKTTGLDWYQGYFSIFSAWFRNGSNQDIEHTYSEIVAKVIELNTIHRSVPFVIQTTENTLRCDYSYRYICSLNRQLKTKVSEYAYWQKLAYRTIRVILPERKQGLAPSLPQNAGQEGLQMRKSGWRPLAYWLMAGLLALLAGGYFLWHSYLQKAGVKIVRNEGRPASSRASKPDPVLVLPVYKDDENSQGPLYGIDISRYQGKLEKEIDSLDSLRFVICKATEGAAGVDPDFLYNWKFIGKKHLVRGAYHFFHSDVPAARQGQHFLSMIGDLQPADLPPVIDIEAGSIKTATVDKRALNRNLLDLLELVHRQTGRKPIIYSNLAFINEFLLSDSLAGYSLWLAEYSGQASPILPLLWKNRGYVFWQKTDHYSIGTQKTDFDVFNGDEQALKNYLLKN